MNIIDYKVNENKLDRFIIKATSQCGNQRYVIAMNDDTRNILIAQTKNSSAFIRNCKSVEYYCGVQILIDNTLELGEVRCYTEVLL